MSCPGEGKPDSAVGRGRGGGARAWGEDASKSWERSGEQRRKERERGGGSITGSESHPTCSAVCSVNSFLAEGWTEQPFLLLSPQPGCNGRQTRREKSQRERLNPFPTGLKPVICILQRETFPASSPASSPPASQPSPSPDSSPPLGNEEFKVGRNSRLGPRIQLSTGEAERGPAFTSWNTALCQEEAKVGFFFLFSA